MPVDAPAKRTKPIAVLITNDAEAIEHLVEKAGFDVVGRSDTAVNGERLAAYHLPDLVVVEHALKGEPGWDALPHLRRASPDSKVVLLLAEDGSSADHTRVDGCAITTYAQLQDLAADGGDLRAWIDAAVTVEAANRRSGRDRRTRQDWSVVGFEKRDRPDRRARREE
jgi:DNA-binding NarL/FixJ family response regulator